MVEFYVKTQDPKSHIEACSLINYFNCEIITDRICENDEPFYGVFYVRSTEESFEVFTEFSIGITVEYPPGKTLR
jgi:hypothetical protein